MAFLLRTSKETPPTYARETTFESPSAEDVIADGDLKYVAEEGGNNSKPSYQEASGAPVESKSPLGYSVGYISIIFLNVSMMVGTGVYSTRMFLTILFLDLIDKKE